MLFGEPGLLYDCEETSLRVWIRLSWDKVVVVVEVLVECEDVVRLSMCLLE